MGNKETPNHPKIAKIILEVQGAIKADEAAIAKWKQRRKQEKEAWDKLSPAEKQKKQSLGMGFQEKTKIHEVQLRNKTRALRRKLRYKIFRIRDGLWEQDSELLALKLWYEKQLKSGWSFKNFTFEWDISAVDPLKAIAPFEWDGEAQEQVVRKEITGEIVRQMFCDPTAFTRQEM